MPVSPWWEIALKLVLASILGGLIGFERERRGKPAGLRTHMLVSLASALFIMASQEAAARDGEPLDSVRAMAGVVQGVGFLGAGVILQSRGEVRWLTTAAALWAAAAVGLGVALGMYYMVVLASVLVFATLRWLGAFEERYIPSRRKSPSGRDKAPTNGDQSPPNRDKLPPDSDQFPPNRE